METSMGKCETRPAGSTSSLHTKTTLSMDWSFCSLYHTADPFLSPWSAVFVIQTNLPQTSRITLNHHIHISTRNIQYHQTYNF